LLAEAQRIRELEPIVVRLVGVVDRNRGESAASILASVIATVEQHGGKQYDDMTLVIVERM
jgi:serine phosphatase RsbU (regulator of sigma subunit)